MERAAHLRPGWAWAGCWFASSVDLTGGGRDGLPASVRELLLTHVGSWSVSGSCLGQLRWRFRQAYESMGVLRTKKAGSSGGRCLVGNCTGHKWTIQREDMGPVTLGPKNLLRKTHSRYGKRRSCLYVWSTCSARMHLELGYATKDQKQGILFQTP